MSLMQDQIEALRQAIEQAEKQEPVAWMSNESAHRLKHGGNSKGAVPVHAKRSNTSKIPLYTTPQPQQAEKQEPWVWQQAPIKTQWGDDMVVADLAIDKDHTVSVYCERDQIEKVEAMFKEKCK
jgi:hypothetical protein